MKVYTIQLTEAEREQVLFWKEMYDMDASSCKYDISAEAKIQNAQASAKYKFCTPDELTEVDFKLAPYGSFISFAYLANSNVKVQCQTEPINVLIAPPRPYNQVTTAMQPVAMMFKVKPEGVDFLKQSIGPARIMQYDIVNEIYYVDNGYCEER